MTVLACLAHWYDALLYVAPVGLVGAGLWFAGRRTPPDDGTDAWEHADDPTWEGHDAPGPPVGAGTSPRHA